MEPQVNNTVDQWTNVVLLVATFYETIHYLPAYRMIIDEANRVPGTNVHFDMAPVANANMTSCPESNANIVNLFSQYYYTENLGQNITISMSPCKPPVARDLSFPVHFTP
ncbi:hypothetical protein RvY_02219 [Ramazzottius varieornatus]|uniref:Uncharacterized protein n=1 Tax=Ramazzottius varieornatus TaxID=947166 RepID=A0A1D1UTK2_RAMVA|nr:hypothetical protein RvY_02219 [Ramazzottius varieornatus]